MQVLKGVDLDVACGEVVFLRGPSGAGKSTLLYILAGLEHPSSGSVEFEGEQLFAIGGSRQAQIRNGRMGFVFQSYFLLPELTALENVLLPAMLGGSANRGVKKMPVPCSIASVFQIGSIISPRNSVAASRSASPLPVPW